MAALVATAAISLACGDGWPMVTGDVDGGGDTPDARVAGIDAGAPNGEPDAGEADGFGPYPVPAYDGLIRGVDDSFWANTDDFVAMALERDVKIYWTITTANFFHRPEYRDLGRQMVLDPSSLFDNALIPLLERYGDTGVIWAIDCMNEPEAMIAGPDGNREDWGVTWDEMRGFLRACADTVHAYAPGVRVSAGSGWHDWDNVAAGRYSGLGFDFLDFHVYDDDIVVPTAASFAAGVPIVIGECGQGSDQRDDQLQLRAVTACFAGAEAGGYDAALAWYYDHADGTNQHGHLRADGSWRPVRAAYDAYAGNPDLTIGLNLAWLGGAYDHDFAINPRHPGWGVSYDHEVARAVLDAYADARIGVMRLWAFESMEGLPFHVVFDDFETDRDGWTGDGQVSASLTDDYADDGGFSLALRVDAGEVGWHGAVKRWPADRPLNLEHASQWRFTARNELGEAVGVNLAFVTGDGDARQVYQTRSGTGGAQLWLEAGETGERIADLSETGFAGHWATQDAPGIGVARPSADQLRDVRELRVRVHLSDSQLPVAGNLYIDAVRIR